MRVSVIIPTFNRKDVLRLALDSSLARIGEDDEVIVVDDGSTDGTAEALRPAPDCVRIIRTRNGGPAAARNAGIRNSRGEFLAFLDSDDEWLPGGLDEQVEALRADEGLGLSYAEYRSVGENGEPVATRPRDPQAGEVLLPLLRRNFVTTSTAVVPRRALDRVGVFDESLCHSMDWDLWLRIAEHLRFHYLPRVAALYRFHAGQRIRERTRVDDCRGRILTKSLERYRVGRPGLVPLVTRLLAYRLLRLGRLKLREGDRTGARESFRAAAQLRPLARLTAARYGLLTRAAPTG